MLEGLVIIDKRIDTNPEEFTGNNEKWVRIDNRLKHMVEDGYIKLTLEEELLVQKIKDKLGAIREEYHRQQFNKRVFETLMRGVEEDEPEPEPERKPRKISVSKQDLEIIKELHRRGIHADE